MKARRLMIRAPKIKAPKHNRTKPLATRVKGTAKSSPWVGASKNMKSY